MKERPRIVFFGTPGFAARSLEYLIEQGYHVAAVVTAPDRPAGRGLKLTAPEVSIVAQNHGVPVLQPLNLKDPSFLSDLAGFNPDLQIVIAFRMLPRQVWELPPMGTLNLHASLLPRYRGAAPINRAIMNGEKVTGLTTFFINDMIDTGKILLSVPMEIGDEETAGSLHDRMMVRGAELVAETVDRLMAGTVVPVTQEVSEGEILITAPKIFREDCRVDWNAGCRAVFNQVRGLSPYPGAFTEFSGPDGQIHQLKIFRAKQVGNLAAGVPGTISRVGKERLMVSSTDGWIELEEVKPEGRRIMQVGDFMRGYGHLFPEMHVK